MKQEALKMELSEKELEGITGGTLQDFVRPAFFAVASTPIMIISGEDVESKNKLNASQRAGLAAGFAAIIASSIAIERACCWAYKKITNN